MELKKLPADAKDSWLTALRSGTQEQYRGGTLLSTVIRPNSEDPMIFEKNLPEDLKRGWLIDLRSGAFTQHRTGSLFRFRRTDTDSYAYCCLGVLAHRLGIPYDDDGWTTGVPPQQHVPTDVWDVLQQQVSVGVTVMQYLAGLNDTHSKTFPEIADWIEAHL